jgi:hypothetical protein
MNQSKILFNFLFILFILNSCVPEYEIESIVGQTESEVFTVNCANIIKQGENEPLYILIKNGKESIIKAESLKTAFGTKMELPDIDPTDIAQVDVYLSPEVIKQYGAEGAYGVVKIRMK